MIILLLENMEWLFVPIVDYRFEANTSDQSSEKGTHVVLHAKGRKLFKYCLHFWPRRMKSKGNEL